MHNLNNDYIKNVVEMSFRSMGFYSKTIDFYYSTLSNVIIIQLKLIDGCNSNIKVLSDAIKHMNSNLLHKNFNVTLEDYCETDLSFRIYDTISEKRDVNDINDIIDVVMGNIIEAYSIVKSNIKDINSLHIGNVINISSPDGHKVFEAYSTNTDTVMFNNVEGFHESLPIGMIMDKPYIKIFPTSLKSIIGKKIFIKVNIDTDVKRLEETLNLLLVHNIKVFLVGNIMLDFDKLNTTHCNITIKDNTFGEAVEIYNVYSGMTLYKEFIFKSNFRIFVNKIGRYLTY